MCEIRRVLLSRKYILLVVIMLISNMAVFQYYQIDTLSKLKSEDTFTMFVIELENKQEEEHKEFYDKLSNISIEKEKMLNISIFSDEGSFAYKNIVKTEQDYNRIMEVTLSDINDYAVDAFLEYDVI